MNIKATILVLSVLFSSPVLADETEEQCKNGVETTLKAIEMLTQQKGEQQKLKDLSVEDIKEIQKTGGHCEAMRQINKRTIN